jgi:NAD(P)-dependent dehydrogenase (short-subunit alcohol dehydrogenase family)
VTSGHKLTDLNNKINIKGTLIVWQSFHATANKGAVFVGTATAAVTLPVTMAAGQTSYVASKLGLIKFLEVLAAEEPNISVRVLHPGVVDTDMADKSGIKEQLPQDKGMVILQHVVCPTDNLVVELPGHFTVWLASPEGAFLAGRMVSCNWDVEELKAVAHKVPESGIFRSTLSGYGNTPLAVTLKA